MKKDYSKIFILTIISILINGCGKKKNIQIAPLSPYVLEDSTVFSGKMSKRMAKYFTIKNFDYHDKNQLLKIDSFVAKNLDSNYNNYDDYYFEFYNYTNELNEKLDWKNGGKLMEWHQKDLLLIYLWSNGKFYSLKIWDNGKLIEEQEKRILLK